MDSVQYSFVITEQQVQIIAEGLANLPWKMAHPVLAELDKQVSAQKTSQTEAK